MKYTLQSYIIWEFGRRTDSEGRPHQEDYVLPAVDENTADDRLFVLCDGMGGHDGGEIASQAVCETMGKWADVADERGVFTDEMFRQALAAAYDALDERDTGAVRKMGTTMTFLRLHAAGATVAHIGDSRVYHIRPGADAEGTQILFMTSDHSLVNQLVRIGEMTPEEAAVSPRKNVLVRAMQPHTPPRAKADIAHISDIRPGDYFYMCSDGMLEKMTDDELRHIFSAAGGSPEEKVETLIAATADNSDNHTAILVNITGVEDVAGVDGATASERPGLHSSERPGLLGRKFREVIIGVAIALAIALAAWIMFRPAKAPAQQGVVHKIQSVRK